MTISTKKAWGISTRLASGDSWEVHQISVDPGGYCSVHLHEHKSNLFSVASGSMHIHVWHGTKVERVWLEAGEVYTVTPGVKHQFRSETGCVAIEVYWSDCRPGDIERFTTGGIEP